MAEGADQPHVPGTDGTPGCNLPSSSRTRVGIAIFNRKYNQQPVSIDFEDTLCWE
ncbi:hypothetical protein DPMN_028120 [Dreissena polymorpha]|uniref:Uncharacterized protein n=1 Tax=Dreissena polymorpha TaxID=45954 RepID=A0A9D4RE31_DREPO|nr:hypothetical protein DPMN_028120 [Dreissena polymorpha]